MTKFTNKHKFKSRSLVAALKSNAGYDLTEKPDNLFSVTEIIDAPKAKILFTRHEDELTIDVFDKLWMMTGSGKHFFLELATKEDPTFMTEERWFMNVKSFSTQVGEPIFGATEGFPRSGIYLSGKMDCYDKEDMIIEDYKETSKWTFVFNPDGKKEWVAQINIHAYALRKMGHEVKGGRIVAILRDWGKRDASSANTPLPIKELDIPLWKDEVVEQYITSRVELHESMKKLSDDEIPPCTKDERWQNTNKKTGKVTETRCEGNGVNIYCPQRGFCNFYRELVGAVE